LHQSESKIDRMKTSQSKVNKNTSILGKFTYRI